MFEELNRRMRMSAGFAVILLGVIFLMLGVGTNNYILGIITIMIGMIPFFQQWRKKAGIKRAAAETARLTAAKAKEAAAKAKKEEEEAAARRIEEERRSAAERATMMENVAYKRLHTQINEMIGYAQQLQIERNNPVLLRAMMDVVGRIASQREIEDRLFADTRIMGDTSLLLEELTKAGLKDDILFKRAARVLHYSAPDTVKVSIRK